MIDEKVLVKCPKCSADVLSGQRFCANCGAEQQLELKTKEEIVQMGKIIEQLAKAETKSEGGSMSKMMFSLSSFMAIQIALKWVLGYATNEALEALVKVEENKK